MGRRGGLFLAALLALASPAGACTVAPHQATQMPESLSNLWPGHGGSLAWYDGPTTRYPHGVLGDTVEATRLHAYSEAAQSICGDQSVTLPDELVFEDIAPRLADLDFDGLPEIIVVQSHQSLGAQLAIYQAANDGIGLDLVATTPFIGQRNRWLAPVGVADFNGDGQMDVAYVDRPHLARTLRVWSFVPGGLDGQGSLREIAALGGLTNHRIGEDFITGGVRDCGDGPEMVVANTDWTRVMAVRMADGTLDARPIAPFSASAVTEALACAL
ncbi:VCBS repeat-containing protein [Rhodobacterales bacterium HKCCE4037]|nr:VCBS repeat-containing protein [Rhodobacterales bacterium HKCCE4037]